MSKFEPMVNAAYAAALATENGDIEIAKDQQQASAWLAALATAGMYFAFREIEKVKLQAIGHPETIAFLGFAAVSLFMMSSLISAYSLRRANLQFSAYTRNLIVAYEMDRCSILQNVSLLKAPAGQKEPSAPFWTQVVYVVA